MSTSHLITLISLVVHFPPSLLKRSYSTGDNPPPVLSLKILALLVMYMIFQFMQSYSLPLGLFTVNGLLKRKPCQL